MTDEAATQAFEQLAEISAGRGGIYRILAEAFRDPNELTVKGLVDGTSAQSIDRSLDWLGTDRSIYDEAIGLVRRIGDQAAGGDPAKILQGLKVEYARLFIGPPRAVVQPYASMHVAAAPSKERLLNIGGSVRTVEQMYRDAGVQVTTALREPPDHISTELEFLFYLCGKEQTAWSEGDNEDAREWRRREREFVDEHLKDWGLKFFEAVAVAAAPDFYNAMASLGSVFLRMESGAFSPA